MNSSPFSMGWLLAMFDLPVMIDAERRAASRFRNDLLDDGFLMIQFSVYARPCVSFEQQNKHAENIRKIAPRSGNVRLIFITDQQWIKSICVIGERKPEEVAAHASTRKNKRQKQTTIPNQIEFWE